MPLFQRSLGRISAIALLSFSLANKAIAEDSIETIRNQAIAACARHESVSGKIRISADMIIAGATVNSESNGTYEHLRRGEKILFRVDTKNVILSKLQKREGRVDQDITTISDGQYCFTLTERKGRKPTATKAAPQPGQTVLADQYFFQGIILRNELRILPDQKIEGKDTWVIEATPKIPDETQPAKSVYYIQKETGIRVKSTGHDATGKRIQLTALTDLKIDPKLDPRRFIMEIPDGVTIVDLTRK